MHLQVEAIKAGTQPGLTMVVGPPGTGKTDTAVQIMHVLYHNCPGQRTLLIAHSNQVAFPDFLACHRWSLHHPCRSHISVQ
jgi:superfamily II DNA or RNA helicase